MLAACPNSVMQNMLLQRLQVPHVVRWTAIHAAITWASCKSSYAVLDVQCSFLFVLIAKCINNQASATVYSLQLAWRPHNLPHAEQQSDHGCCFCIDRVLVCSAATMSSSVPLPVRLWPGHYCLGIFLSLARLSQVFSSLLRVI